MQHPTVLVLFTFPDPTIPTEGFLDGLSYPDVQLLGFYPLDEREDETEIRAAREEELQAQLETQAERFEQRGIRTTTELIFNHDKVAARRAIAKQEGIDGILLPGESNTIGKILIAARDLRNLDAKTSLLNIVQEASLIQIDLLHIISSPEGETNETGEHILEELEAAFVEAGMPATRIEQDLRTSTDPTFELMQAARNYDLVVVGQTERDIEDRIFGPVSDQISTEEDTPVLIVR